MDHVSNSVVDRKTTGAIQEPISPSKPIQMFCQTCKKQLIDGSHCDHGVCLNENECSICNPKNQVRQAAYTTELKLFKIYSQYNNQEVPINLIRRDPKQITVADKALEDSRYWVYKAFSCTTDGAYTLCEFTGKKTLDGLIIARTWLENHPPPSFPF